ncbi:MAG: sulfotransferase, partial [Deltaproteobacteria bacterium]|nr:sulfotransferase [Deltaproteobacteria bacterium]
MSADRPDDIRIADLADPVLTPMQIAAIAHVGKSEIAFDEDAVLDAACKKTGLDDFGPV